MTMIIDGTAGVTFPDASVQPKSGYGPAFSAYATVGTTLPNNTFTKLLFDTKDFDTANSYTPATGRFNPQVAGYYQINACAYLSGSTATGVSGIAIYKNGSIFIYGNQGQNSVGATITTANAVVYLNGSTDYVEVWGVQTTGGTVTSTTLQRQFQNFQGIFIRGA
jgi:hypothetical protein